MFKMVKFPYGTKYIQNLNKIENGQLSNHDKKKENSSQVILSIFSGMKQLYSSLHTEGSNVQPNKDKNNKDNFGDENNSYQGNNSIRGGDLTQGSYDDNNDELSDDNSLKSLEDQENIRFSPNKKSPSPNNQNGHGGKTLSSRTDAINDTTEKMYDPFETLKKKHSITFPIFYDPILKKIKYYNTNHFQSSSASSWYYNNDSSSYINSSNTIRRILPPEPKLLSCCICVSANANANGSYAIVTFDSSSIFARFVAPIVSSATVCPAEPSSTAIFAFLMVSLVRDEPFCTTATCAFFA
jgi:hypothetical protein